MEIKYLISFFSCDALEGEASQTASGTNITNVFPFFTNNLSYSALGEFKNSLNHGSMSLFPKLQGR